MTATVQHLYLAFGAVFLGVLVAVPLGIWLARHERYAQPVLAVAGIIQTIPSLAFFGFVLPILGVGVAPALLVLFLYSLLPILRNIYTGIQGVERSYIESGLGMGMSGRQLLALVELPLAFPVIVALLAVLASVLLGWIERRSGRHV